MTLSEFAKLYPGTPFALRYVERGEHNKRSFVWHIMFTSDYFTSDTDRPVYDHRGPPVPDGFGETPEAAIDDLMVATEKRLRCMLERSKEEAASAEAALAEHKKRLRDLTQEASK